MSLGTFSKSGRLRDCTEGRMRSVPASLALLLRINVTEDVLEEGLHVRAAAYVLTEQRLEHPAVSAKQGGQTHEQTRVVHRVTWPGHTDMLVQQLLDHRVESVNGGRIGKARVTCEKDTWMGLVYTAISSGWTQRRARLESREAVPLAVVFPPLPRPDNHRLNVMTGRVLRSTPLAVIRLWPGQQALKLDAQGFAEFRANQARWWEPISCTIDTGTICTTPKHLLNNGANSGKSPWLPRIISGGGWDANSNISHGDKIRTIGEQCIRRKRGKKPRTETKIAAHRTDYRQQLAKEWLQTRPDHTRHVHTGGLLTPGEASAGAALVQVYVFGLDCLAWMTSAETDLEGPKTWERRLLGQVNGYWAKP
ncbi:hypothetical protein ElyMa_006881500 [Elysia marginata]|uniref:Uncharacterized protein n=1 Tax=Elysia marginata TaxID=1093978 RepID=A0AAV4JBT7_9GAST|nr:hypothetical protein ElyMa_006881500 [Elysia marginata]